MYTLMRAALGAALLFAANVPPAVWPQNAVAEAEAVAAPVDNSATENPAILTLEEAERLALAADPGIPMYGAREAAFQERAVAALALPDPKLLMGFMAVPVDTFDLEQEPMTQVQVGLMQHFPRAGLLEHTSEQLQAKAQVQSAQSHQRRRQVVREVRRLWMELFYWNRAESVVRDTIDLFRQMVDVTTSQYSHGRSNMQDVLRAELELNLLEERRIRIGQMQDQARAGLSRWIGEAPARRALPDEPPEMDSPAELRAMVVALELHPLVEAQAAQVKAAESALGVARDKYNSQWTLSVLYGLRPGTAPDGSEWADFVSVRVTVDLPFFTENKQDRGVQAGLMDLQAAMWGKNDVMRALQSSLQEQHAKWTRLMERLSVYDTELLSLANNNSEASLRAYQNDVADFSTLVRARIMELETRLKWWRLRIDLAQTLIQIKSLVGEEL
ncbi:MAG: TolC family protein [SAR324 cluster bacterium]|nr:TolC family protein [SAR324 cluster bacterium]